MNCMTIYFLIIPAMIKLFANYNFFTFIKQISDGMVSHDGASTWVRFLMHALEVNM